jgi:hypothetical protein
MCCFGKWMCAQISGQNLRRVGFAFSLSLAQICAAEQTAGYPETFSISDPIPAAQTVYHPPGDWLNEPRAVVPVSVAEPAGSVSLTDLHSLSGTSGTPYENCGCNSDCGLPPVCDDCPTHGLVAYIGNDAWRGLPDGGFGASNFGLSTGVNFGTRLGALTDATGIGGQIGGTFGVYDWLGASRIGDTNVAQTQGFFTYGLFRKANAESAWSAAVVQDWMVNDHFGQQGSSPTMSQVRVQIGYALNTWNEIGFWGAWHVLEAERQPLGPAFPTIVDRSVDQYNGYWHHKWWDCGPDTWLWLGLPENNRVQGPGSLGDFIIGWIGEAPLSDRISIYGNVTYMAPSSGVGLQGVAEETWNVSFGVAFYLGGNSRSSTVAGNCWMPALPVANNGTFLVDEGARF